MSIFNLPCPHNDGKECRYCHNVTAQDGWRFKGCFCPPLKGMFIAEVKECPDKAQKGEQYINKSAVAAEIKKRLSLLEGGTGHPEVMKRVEGVIKGYKSILSFLDTLETKEVEEESVSNDLEEFAKRESELFAEREYEIDYIDRNALAKGYYWGVKAGVQWQKEQMIKEVDLEKELDKYTADNFWALEGNNESPYLLEKDDMLKVAKHFYELGMMSKYEVKHDDTSLTEHK